MAGDTAKSDKAEGGVLRRVGQAVILLATAVLVWVGKDVLARLDRAEEQQQHFEVLHEKMMAEFSALKDDDAKWAALASLQEQMTTLRIRTEIMITLWKHREEEGLGISHEHLVNDVVHTLAGEESPHLDLPEANPDVLRERYEQRYPNEPAKK